MGGAFFWQAASLMMAVLWFADGNLEACAAFTAAAFVISAMMALHKDRRP